MEFTEPKVVNTAVTAGMCGITGKAAHKEFKNGDSRGKVNKTLILKSRIRN
jgi:hypothetical protein